jgi:Mce-associated membrane protein
MPDAHQHDPENTTVAGNSQSDEGATTGSALGNAVDNSSTNDVTAQALGDESTRRRLTAGRWTVRRQLIVAGLAIVIGLSTVVGWLGYRTHQTRQISTTAAHFVEVARQGAINLTTIDWEHADADVERILTSAAGTFYDDFTQRSQPFIEVVKQTKSKSIGTVTEAGLESISDDRAQVLVAVNVKTTLQGQPEVAPRSWRMRISVQKQGDDVKVSNVEFVP